VQNHACTNPRCKRKDYQPITIPEPLPLLVEEFVSSVYSGGPVNSLDDAPLGISRGIIDVSDGQVQRVFFRNNSSQPISLSRYLGPPWVGVSLAAPDPAGPVVRPELITLAPGGTCELLIIPSFFRPPWMRFTLRMGERELQIVTEAESPFYALGLFGFFLLLLHHWLTLVTTVCSSPTAGNGALTLSFGLLFGWLTLLAPAWPRALFTQLVSLLERIQGFIQGKRFARSAARFLAPAADPGAEFLKRLVLGLLVSLILALCLWPVWSLFMAVLRLFPFLANSYLGGFLLYVGSAALLVLFWYPWWREYNLNLLERIRTGVLWLWNSVAGKR
jgi:hypothetical protein